MNNHAQKRTYEITLKELTEGNEAAQAKLVFDNHDDIFKIIGLAKSSGFFADENEALRCVIGLKLFTGVVIENRRTEPFDGMHTAMMTFMKALKEKLKAAHKEP